MSSTQGCEGPGEGLNHIYFFIDKARQSRPSTSSTDTTNQCATPRSEAASLDSEDTEATTAMSNSSSLGNSHLNPHAKSFAPPALSNQTPTIANVFEMRETADRGYGLFATAHIPIGARILCESPLLRIDENGLHRAINAYEKLQDSQKAAFDELQFFKPELIDLEQASRFDLIERQDKRLDDDQLCDAVVADHVRIMGIFAANNFAAGKGLAVFEKASRLNHSCVPNVHHSFNPTLQKQTVHAVRDIQPGEELCTTYLGGPGCYYVRSQRVEMLRSNYGFTCTCTACSDPSGASESRRQLMANLAWGLQQYLERSAFGMTFVPTSPAEALAQSEAFIHLLLEEGLFTVELMKAYRTASTQALNISMYEKAMAYAKNEADVEGNCLGTELNDLVQLGVASSCWVETVRSAAARAGVALGKGGKYNHKKSQKGPKSQAQREKKRATKKKQQMKKKELEAASKAKERVEQKEADRSRKEAERKRKEYDTAFPTLA
ncbi:hypothetical protein D0864_03151 [Hortaea werneckii]|uniref:SET domain-containing protein n=1 Tax=Hortaea werneckii TaxID=91943 RepID=A0A3M7GPF9_HORWE|nr:hypothetical protein D0864_03151 [Hortaea werneckii]